MELELLRTYDPEGTNGELGSGGKRICFTIELPWLHNQHNISCIPEGRYELLLLKRQLLTYPTQKFIYDQTLRGLSSKLKEW